MKKRETTLNADSSGLEQDTENLKYDEKEVETTGVSYVDDEGNKMVSDFVLALLSLCINHLNMLSLRLFFHESFHELSK